MLKNNLNYKAKKLHMTFRSFNLIDWFRLYQNVLFVITIYSTKKIQSTILSFQNSCHQLNIPFSLSFNPSQWRNSGSFSGVCSPPWTKRYPKSKLVLLMKAKKKKLAINFTRFLFLVSQWLYQNSVRLGICVPIFVKGTWKLPFISNFFWHF